MKLPSNKKLLTDKDGKQRIVEQISPKLNTSRKLQMRKSKRQKVVRRSPT